MVHAKPFRSIDELLDLLESRHLIIENRAEATLFLSKNSYYSVINGYKSFFLDPNKTNSDVEVYQDGATFRHLVAIYSFDRQLRFILMKWLITAETSLKTATVQAFCRKNTDCEAYLDPASYCGKAQYRGKNYTKNLIKLLSMLQRTRDGEGGKYPYIEHYLSKYKEVPLWVVANALTFGCMSHFYATLKTGTQNEVCRIVGNLSCRRISPRQMQGIYANLSAFRNICAHEGRLFCARTGKRRDKRFVDLLKDLAEILTPRERKALIDDVMNAIDSLDDTPNLDGKLLVKKEMGIEGLDLMSLL